MALNLIKAGFSLVVYNRTSSKTRALVEAGAQAVLSPREVAERADCIITMVTGPDDVRQVVLGVDGVIEGAKPGSTVIDMSTISPQATQEVAAALREKGIHMLDAPVSGGDIGAKEATLTIMVGGDADVLARCMPLFRAMGKKVTHIGGIGSGQVAKLVNQVLVSVNLLAVTEALTLAAKAGVEPTRVLQAVSEGAAGSWQLSNLGPRMIAGDLAPGFMIKLLQKDLRLALGEADRLQMPLLGTSLVHQLLRTAESDGLGDAGTQALIHVVERLAGRSNTRESF